MWKSEADMRAIVRYVWYEWEMFSWAAEVIPVDRAKSRTPR
jgi:hypothetical protein